MILTDVHTHSTYSADGLSPLKDMVGKACGSGLKYYGVSEHFDFDYNALGLLINGQPAYTDAEGYFKEGRILQKNLQNSRSATNLLIGCELGFSDDADVVRQYRQIIERFKPDFVVNSVHTCDGHDCYFNDYFIGKDKQTAYRRYLERVLESLSAPYKYDIVAHIGYVSRNAPYADPKIRYADFSELYDEIFKGIISRGKILEVNSSARTAGSDFLPDVDALARYFELGGRAVSFSSDAHATDRICDKRALVVSALKGIGFKCITVPTPQGYVEVEI
ncbi:MAG: histidinol-phosphatase HisJ family protein [Candidatus Coproplasma sp.]